MTVSRTALREDVARAFGLGRPPAIPLVGLEVEAIPVDDATGRPLPIARTLRALEGLNWPSLLSGKSGVPELRRADGARVTFEPGGQIEYSSAPQRSGSALLADVEGALSAIADALAPERCSLLFAGLDPSTPIAEVPLQLDAERYRRMDAYFASRGPAGRRMMRQTASIQLCIDAGDAPIERWRLLASLAPVAAAMFANSPFDSGVFTAERSRRRRIWSELDPARTGLRALGADPVQEYFEFALEAPAFLLGNDPQRAEPFGEWIARGAARPDWLAHLSTLFPDVRPRGYFEFRVADAVAGDALPALIALVAGIAWHSPSAAAARLVLPQPDESLMVRAARAGLGDPVLAAAAHCASRLALDACRSLGRSLLDDTDAARARRFFESYTNCGRSPADDARAPAAA
jgi:glutamate--cysteine ligase